MNNNAQQNQRFTRYSTYVPWLVLALLMPVFTGALVMFLGGAPRSRWVTQLVFGATGIALRYVVLATPARWTSTFTVPALLGGVVLVTATLFARGIQDVHRWLTLGPFMLNVSALLCPIVLVTCWRHGSLRVTVPLLLGLQLVHVAQPDAGQALALGAGAVTLLATQRQWVSIALHLGLIALAWTRPDPLGAVAFVEDMGRQAMVLGSWALVLTVISVVVSVLAPALVARRVASVWPGALTLGAYLLGAVVAWLTRNAPAPLLGASASPILGAFLGVAALERAARTQRS
jgi:cell division protein FtsW (lipid II flippase)